MTTTLSHRIRILARERDVEESAIIQEAVKAGVETLWRDLVIEQYLHGDLTKEAAVDELGHDVIRDVDRAQSAVEADAEWGLDGADF